mmetsp:Transcript_1503/g.3895  ORF Transcript_1503/g.3895 Transcript_1503/m.3895 type:complete len:416 (+) Transcript_1503:2839-4086(+)
MSVSCGDKEARFLRYARSASWLSADGEWTSLTGDKSGCWCWRCWCCDWNGLGCCSAPSESCCSSSNSVPVSLSPSPSPTSGTPRILCSNPLIVPETCEAPRPTTNSGDKSARPLLVWFSAIVLRLEVRVLRLVRPRFHNPERLEARDVSDDTVSESMVPFDSIGGIDSTGRPEDCRMCSSCWCVCCWCVCCCCCSCCCSRSRCCCHCCCCWCCSPRNRAKKSVTFVPVDWRLSPSPSSWNCSKMRGSMWDENSLKISDVGLGRLPSGDRRCCCSWNCLESRSTLVRDTERSARSGVFFSSSSDPTKFPLSFIFGVCFGSSDSRSCRIRLLLPPLLPGVSVLPPDSSASAISRVLLLLLLLLFGLSSCCLVGPSRDSRSFMVGRGDDECITAWFSPIAAACSNWNRSESFLRGSGV